MAEKQPGKARMLKSKNLPPVTLGFEAFVGAAMATGKPPKAKRKPRKKYRMPAT